MLKDSSGGEVTLECHCQQEGQGEGQTGTGEVHKQPGILQGGVTRRCPEIRHSPGPAPGVGRGDA